LKQLFLYLLLFFSAFLKLEAQKPDFYLNFDQILDNREYFTEYGYHQSIFGMRVNPGLSFQWDTVHEIRTGINYMYEYGGEFLAVKPQFDLYYQYTLQGWNLRAGSFSRREILDYPRVLLADSLSYYRPQVEGLSLSYTWSWGKVHSWMDWLGRESRKTREAILAGLDLRLNSGPFFLEVISTRYHLARTTDPADGNTLYDDGSILIMGGWDLPGSLLLDQCRLSTGWLSTYVYDRPDAYAWGQGWLSRVDLAYRIFGIKASLHLGKPSPLAFGERLYGHGSYGRIDLFVDPFRKNTRISSRIGWNLHWLPGEGLFHSQHLLISVRLS